MARTLSALHTHVYRLVGGAGPVNRHTLILHYKDCPFSESVLGVGVRPIWPHFRLLYAGSLMNRPWSVREG